MNQPHIKQNLKDTVLFYNSLWCWIMGRCGTSW